VLAYPGRSLSNWEKKSRGMKKSLTKDFLNIKVVGIICPGLNKSGRFI
jgi:hypothetical protein